MDAASEEADGLETIRVLVDTVRADFIDSGCLTTPDLVVCSGGGGYGYGIAGVSKSTSMSASIADSMPGRMRKGNLFVR